MDLPIYIIYILQCYEHICVIILKAILMMPLVSVESNHNNIGTVCLHQLLCVSASRHTLMTRLVLGDAVRGGELTLIAVRLSTVCYDGIT